MIEKTLKTTQGKLRVKIPTQLSDVSIGQMMAMQAKPNLNDVEAISILSGIALDDLHQVKDINDFHAFGDAVLALSYQIKYLYNSDVIPKQVSFLLPGANHTKTIKVMQNLAIEPAGAFMAARDIIAEEVNSHIKQFGEDDWQANFNPSLNTCCQVLAHYFFCSATGKPYNEYQAEEFVNEIKKMRGNGGAAHFEAFFSLISQLIQTENELLASPPSALEKRAGIQSFKKFKYINTINSLAGGDVTKWDIILNMPYERVLTKLLLNKTEAEYQKKYMEMSREG